MFDQQFAESLLRRYGSAPAAARPDVFAVATAAEHLENRRWMNETLRQLPEPGRSRLFSRLRRHEFATGWSELAAAAILMRAGHRLEYEPAVGRQGTEVSPDFVSRSPTPMIVEVWTRGISDSFKREGRSWGLLGDRIADVPRPAIVTVESPVYPALEPPDSKQAKHIASGLRSFLLRTSTRPGMTSELGGYVFRFVGEHGDGLRARLVRPARGGWVDADLIVRAIRTKVARYRDAAEAEHMPLVVILASEPDAPLDFSLLKSAVNGQQSLSFSFSAFAPGGLIADHKVQLRQQHVPETFDPALSAVGFIERLPFAPGRLMLMPVPTAVRPLPTTDGPGISWDSSFPCG